MKIENPLCPHCKSHRTAGARLDAFASNMAVGLTIGLFALIFPPIILFAIIPFAKAFATLGKQYEGYVCQKCKCRFTDADIV